MNAIIDKILSFQGTFFTILITIGIYYAAKWVLEKSSKGKADWGIIRSIVLFSIVLVGAIAIVLSLPMDPSTKGNISSLVGIVISAVFALSSATFMGNGMAGIMLRTINSFKPGDFIRTGELFGRVTERGLFHTEIQTENRDLTTIPNLFLTTNPVKVIRTSGTFISGICSLGYDVNRINIEKALLKATEAAGLKDGFVRITDLGDFSVVYKTYGLLEDIKTIISAESKLNAMILDCLHEAGIEIVSPNFMNQRPIGDTVFIPKKVRKSEQQKLDDVDAPENVIFDKADEAESLEKRKEKLAEIDLKIKSISEEMKAAETDEEKEQIKKRLDKWTLVKEKMLEKIETKLDEINSTK